MYLKNSNYKPNEFAGLINVSVRTLQRWDNEGTLKAFKTPTDRDITLTSNTKSLKG